MASERVHFVNEGQLVRVKIKGIWVPVEVTVAMGDTAQVVNELLCIDEWRRISELRLARPVAGTVEGET